MKTHKIQDREAGNVIETGLTEAAAKARIKEFEQGDKQDGTFVPDFYEIKEEKHTQGQWSYAIGKEKTFITSENESIMIASLDSKMIQSEANARLIAAAPELLETLQQTFKRLEAYRQDFLEDTPANEQQREIIIDMETTILGAIRK